MTKKDIKDKLAKRVPISYGHLNNVLAGRKNLGYKRAKALSNELHTEIEVWCLDGNKGRRREAFDNYVRRCAREAIEWLQRSL